ncbi:uncharacterized protein LOC107265783 isoform X1 [Cephus cinctus]|uniref:Uncharacterized protein LOC107265783 isoform X1 n=1 Tax=Cephus cinctus TaxID=211228 RepID=A0AAJ7FGS2_CEPCN|nr:uncharacterized protein LOC107265783 isoform X1 [Cephus cinctus]
MSSSTIMETFSGSDFNICEDEQVIPESNNYPDLHLETLTTCESQCWNSNEKCGFKDIIILTGKKYLTNLSQYTKKSVLQLKDDNFVRSLVASIALFTIGMKLTRELDAWNVSSIIY